MNKTAARIALLLLLAIAGAAPLYAQSGGGGGEQVRVSFAANVPGALIRLNGTVIGETPLTVRIRPGRYSLGVSKPGYSAYLAAVQITNRPTQAFTITLRPAGVSVQITANVLNAAVYIDGRLAGATPASLELPAGRYSVRLEAQGYRSLETTLQIAPEQGGRRFVFNLQPAATRLEIRVPAQYLGPQYLGAPGDAAGLRIYVDDQLVASGSASVQLEIQPGTHVVRIVSPRGGLSLSREFTFEPGRTYRLDLLMDLVAR